MKRSLSVLLLVAILFSQQLALSQTQNTQQQGVAASSEQNRQPDAASRLAYLQNEDIKNLRGSVQKRTNKNLKEYNEGNLVGWQYVNAVCAATSGTSGDASKECAVTAIAEVNAECSLGSKYFKKSSKAWTMIGISMVIASAAFTGVGASTLANAKVFAILGGTTGLGAVTATVNANAAGDQAALGQIRSTLDAFAKFVQSGGEKGAPASNDLIWKTAPIVAGQCAAAANSSGGNTPK